MFTVEHTLKCKGKLSHPQVILSLSNILTREETPTWHGKAPLYRFTQEPVQGGFAIYSLYLGAPAGGARGVAPPTGIALVGSTSQNHCPEPVPRAAARSSCRSYRRTDPPPRCRHPPAGSTTQPDGSAPTPDAVPAPAPPQAAHHSPPTSTQTRRTAHR